MTAQHPKNREKYPPKMPKDSRKCILESFGILEKESAALFR